MKRQLRKDGLGCQGFHGEEESVEHSKRRHTMSYVTGDFKFMDRILSARRAEDPTFISKSAARNR